MTNTVKRIMVPIDQPTLDALTAYCEATNKSMAAGTSDVLRESIPMINTLARVVGLAKKDPAAVEAVLRALAEEQMNLFEVQK